MINKYSILNGVKYFSIDKIQNYFVFITFTKYGFIFETGKNNISSWKFTGLSEEKNINPYELGISFSPKV